MQPTSSIIDNIDINIGDVIKDTLTKSEQVQFAVGFLFLSGIRDIFSGFADLEKIQILIGNRTNKSTAKMLGDIFEKDQEIETQYEINQGKLKAKKEYADDLSFEFKQTDDDKEFLNQLYEIVKAGKLEIKIYTKGTLHAKAYIFTAKQPSIAKGRCLIGSSNLSKSGFYNNTELNVVVDGDENFDKMQKWFMRLWEESHDFSEELLDVIENSRLKAEPTPYEIYMKILYEMLGDYAKNTIDTKYDWVKELYQFQIDAVQQAVEIVKKYNGVFVSDVVGLGKTYTGAIIMKLLTEEKHSRGLILCPAKLQKERKIVLRNFGVNAEVESIDSLKRVTEERGYDKVKYVLVDESHKFKASTTQRYPLLQEFIHKTNKGLILLSATPLNLNGRDIYNQIKLFHKGERTNLPIYPNHLYQFFKGYEKGIYDLSNLLGELMVRRTRLHIKKYYGKDMKRMGKDFPKRIGPFTEEYDLNKDYLGIYDEIESVLGQRSDGLSKKVRDKLIAEMSEDEFKQYRGQFKYAMYFKTNYIKEECFNIDEKGKKTLDGTEFEDIQSVGENLRELAKITFYQRIESSPGAFLSTLERMLRYNKIFLENLKKGYIFKTKHSDELIDYEGLFDDFDEDDNEDFLGKLEGESYDINKFDKDRYIKDVSDDIKLLEDLYDKSKDLLEIEDVKVNKLIDLLKENSDKKVLIFSQYADTAEYLVQKIVKNINNKVVCEMSGSSKENILSILGRFSPKSQKYELKEGEGEIDILVATDIIAEGQNLQDANMVINYDLHWNPVKLIQRIGRIDRIGSENDEIYIYNFYPSNTGEGKLGLRSIVSKRVEAIHKHIGEENKIISQNEKLNQKMLALYDDMLKNGTDNLDEIEEIDDESRSIFVYSNFIKELHDCEENHPEVYKKIVNMPLRMRCTKKGNEKKMLVYCKYGDFDHCYIMDDEGKIENNKSKFLKLAHADFDTKRENLDSKHDVNTCIIENKFYQDLGNAQLSEYFTGEDEKKTSIDMTALVNKIRKYQNEYLDKYDLDEHDMIDTICDFINDGLETWQKRKFKLYKKYNYKDYNKDIISEMYNIIKSIKKEDKGDLAYQIDKKQCVVVSESIIK